MDPLNDETRAWLDDAVRDEAVAPSERARMWKSISANIPPAPTPGLLDRAVPLRHVLGIAALAIGAGVAIGRATTPVPAPVAPPMMTTSSAPPAMTTIEARSAPPPSSTMTTSAAPTPAPIPSTPRSAARPDSSMDEVRTILRAKRALADAHPKEALAALEEHERAYPHGSLAEERDALRVLALCADGRATEGAAERAAFLRAHPLSAYGDRVRAACAP